MIFDFWNYDFLTRALIAAVMIGLALPLIGSLLILRRASLFVDAMSHVALSGVAIATLFSFAPVYVSLATAIAGSSTFDELRRKNRLPGDSVLALLLYGSLALTLIIFSVRSTTGALFNFLFGSIFTVGTSELIYIAAVMLVVILFALYFAKDISQIMLNEDLARTNGVRVNWINRLFAALTGAAVVVAMFSVGALLVGALVIVPALTALRRARGVTQMFLYSMLFGFLGALGGFLLSFYLDWPISGAMVAAVITLLLLSEIEIFARRKIATFAAARNQKLKT